MTYAASANARARFSASVSRASITATGPTNAEIGQREVYATPLIVGPIGARSIGVGFAHVVRAEGFGPSSSRVRIGCSRPIELRPAYAETATTLVVSAISLPARSGRHAPIWAYPLWKTLENGGNYAGALSRFAQIRRVGDNEVHAFSETGELSTGGTSVGCLSSVDSPSVFRQTLLDLSRIDWLIAGGESGPNFRPMDGDWVRELRDHCVHVGTAFFFKQWGGRTPKAGGRSLDGREWSEYPGGPTNGHEPPA